VRSQIGRLPAGAQSWLVWSEFGQQVTDRAALILSMTHGCSSCQPAWLITAVVGGTGQDNEVGVVGVHVNC
jgi:hypothetical protein